VHKTICVLLILMLALTVSAMGQSVDNSASPAPAADKLSDKSNWLDLLLAAEGGGGFFAGPTQPTAYGGFKAGISNVVLSFGYDRIHGENGFSGELSGMLPVFRFPGPQKNEFSNYVRIYAEPGIGNRSGAGGFGPYLSGKVMVVLLSDNRLRLDSDSLPASPYVEYERRFPFQALGQGDNRISFGLMLTLCHSC
jgi:hypothetical protein